VSFVDELRIPNTEDVDGSADGLLRIQDYYNFDLDDARRALLLRIFPINHFLQFQ